MLQTLCSKLRTNSPSPIYNSIPSLKRTKHYNIEMNAHCLTIARNNTNARSIAESYGHV